MDSVDLRTAIRRARDGDPASMPDIVTAAATELGASDVVIYLVDFAHTVLEPLPTRATHAELPVSEDVTSTMAGRAFLDEQPVTAERDDAVRVWLPILEGSDRVGVLALTLPGVGGATLEACEDLALLAGYLIATHGRYTDIYNLHRRRRALTLAASMQWDLLPPLLLKTESVTVAGLVEPAYEVGGDCFDYALNGPVLDLAIMDAMGHGEDSALLAALAIGSYRHDRREARPLQQMHANLDAVLERHYAGSAFSTGLLARLQLETGALTCTNAGHPLPLLVRGGRVIDELSCPPTLPWGFRTLQTSANRPDTKPATMTTVSLEPGDSLVFYTDGVTDSHRPGGEPFGAERLIDLV
ncbi:MAG: serine/threonine-protein phosphatase, partial [Actinobacteria bacterium]|nr:serine/threonine-protein phosphatase [Actinomycetota bacterium]